MSKKQKIAAVNRIGSTPEERSKEMSRRRAIGWSKVSKETKKNHMRKMLLARWGNKIKHV